MLKFDSNHVIVGRQRPLWPGMVSRDGEWIRLANGLVTSSSFDKDRLKVVKFRNALESVLCPSQGCRCGQVTLSRSQFYFYKNDLPLLKLCVCTRQTHAYTKNTCVEVRGHVERLRFFSFYHVGDNDWAQINGLRGEFLYPLSRLAGPSADFVSKFMRDVVPIIWNCSGLMKACV